MSFRSISPAAEQAIRIGALCSFAYLAVYLARNVLGTVTPQMIEGQALTTEMAGTLSSLFFMVYAVGQLINGALGDHIKAKYMMSGGLLLAGIGHQLFSMLTDVPAAACVAYGVTGFGLSMIYAPMTKLVAENTEPIHAVRCNLGYTFASYISSPLAGFLAMLLAWRLVFAVSNAALILMAVLCYVGFTLMERKGLITYGTYQKPKGAGGGLRVLVKHRILRFTAVAVVTGVIRTTVVFWLPTYLSQHLGFSAEMSAGLFTLATLAISASAFVVVFVYERLGHDMDKTLFLSFALSAIGFFGVYWINQPALNIALLIIAIFASNAAASMLWSKYCPGLRDTGMVSGATGYLDFMSYMAASASSSLFAGLLPTVNWQGLILIWFGLMVIGVLLFLPFRRKPAAEEVDEGGNMA